MGDEHPWDWAATDLLELLADPWAKPLGNIGRRKQAATFFAMRVGGRAPALDLLFSAGHYNESYPIIRAAYEDWLTAAYVLQGEGDARWREFRAEVSLIDARVFEAFERLCGSKAARALFKDVPDSVRVHLGKSKREQRKNAWPALASISEELGLRQVHDYVYTRLSAYSHPTARAFDSVFDMQEPNRISAHIPVRDDKTEFQLALWAWWFELRTVTIAQREFGIDSESHSTDLLALHGSELTTCVLVRER